MQDPTRCCFRAVTSAWAAPLTRRSEPLPEMSPACITQDPTPDAMSPPCIPQPPASQWQSFGPTKAVKALCRALAASCSFAGAPPRALTPSIHRRLVEAG